MGSQVEFRTRDGSRAKPHLQVAVSAISASIVGEGPLGKARRGSWLATARISYIDWGSHQIDPETTGTFGVTDTQAKAVYDLSPRHTLTATLVAGRPRWDERDDSYRATAVAPGPRGTSFEGGVHLQARGASLDEVRYFGSERFTAGFDD